MKLISHDLQDIIYSFAFAALLQCSMLNFAKDNTLLPKYNLPEGKSGLQTSELQKTSKDFKVIQPQRLQIFASFQKTSNDFVRLHGTQKILEYTKRPLQLLET
jgi:hypothetical protein